MTENITRKPVYPKFTSPDTFSPITSSAVNFIKNYKHCAHINCWSDEDKSYFFENYLEDSALIWYKEFRENEDNKDKKWTDLVKTFLTEFEDKAVVYELKYKLTQLKQGETENLRDFLYRILNMCYNFDPEMSFDKIQEYFENALHPRFHEQYYMLVENDINLSEFKKLINRIHIGKKREELAALKLNKSNSSIQNKNFSASYNRQQEQTSTDSNEILSNNCRKCFFLRR